MKAKIFYRFLFVVVVIYITAIFSPDTNAQKIAILGVDSSLHNYKKSRHFATTLESYRSTELDKNISVHQLGTEISFYVLNRFALVPNIYFMLPRGSMRSDLGESDIKGIGGGGGGIIRLEVIRFSRHNLYAEAGVGMVFTTSQFPTNGTVWNFTQRYGFGMNIFLSEQSQLSIGYRFMHVSNGKGFVPENPSFNGNGLMFGFKFIPDRVRKSKN